MMPVKLEPVPLSLESSTLPLCHCASYILDESILNLRNKYCFQRCALPLPNYTHRKVREFYERKIVIIFLPINFNMCFGCSKEPSHCDGSFEYPQHVFWMRNKENSFPIRTLIWRPVHTQFDLFSSAVTLKIYTQSP